MATRFPREKQSEFPVHCIGTRKLSNIITVVVLQILAIQVARTMASLERKAAVFGDNSYGEVNNTGQSGKLRTRYYRTSIASAAYSSSCASTG